MDHIRSDLCQLTQQPELRPKQQQHLSWKGPFPAVTPVMDLQIDSLQGIIYRSGRLQYEQTAVYAPGNEMPDKRGHLSLSAPQFKRTDQEEYAQILLSFQNRLADPALSLRDLQSGLSEVMVQRCVRISNLPGWNLSLFPRGKVDVRRGDWLTIMSQDRADEALDFPPPASSPKCNKTLPFDNSFMKKR